MPNSGIEDGRLVGRCLQGDTGAFGELVEKYQRQAVAVAYRLLGNRADAAEVTQDAFLKCYASLKDLDNPQAFVGYLMRIVSNLSLNKRRGRSIRKAASFEEGFGTGSSDSGTDSQGQSLGGNELNPARAIASREMGEALKQAIARLPEKQRRALTLFTIEERSQKEIAEELRCSVEAVKWHVFQARKKLKEQMREFL